MIGTLVGAAFFLVNSFTSTFHANVNVIAESDAFPAGPRPPASEEGAVNILLLGTDGRGKAAQTGQGLLQSQRADTIMVAHLPADRSGVQIMSIMRDSWVDVPGHGHQKINAALPLGGTSLMVATVENLLQTRIDHVALVGFDGFAEMTDALGGIEVQVEKAFTNEKHRFDAGPNHLDGEKALYFVRARYPFADGDFQRVRNQQAFMHALASRAISLETVSNPGAAFGFIEAVTSNLSVDPGFDPQTMMRLAFSLHRVDPEDVRLFTLPAEGTGMIAGQSVVLVDEARLGDVRRAFADDAVDTLERELAGS
ncbi:LCP family protein [Microbacterium sp. NPDC057407]|uniref:LCP family protein n=1 Tax=Microbacterium sp. NPDC057407 TaxID=3346120 RepID=UPI00366BF18F